MISLNVNKLEPEHLSAIRALAEATQHPMDEVNEIYSQTFESLNSDARIKDYLIVLTTKRVLDELRK